MTGQQHHNMLNAGARFFRKYESIIILVLLGCISIYAVYESIRATPLGPNFGSDSVTYMMSAKNLVDGKGLGLINPDGTFRLLPYTPPFYSLVLSLLDLTGQDLARMAFGLNSILLISLILMLGSSLWYFTRSSIAALLLGGLLALSPVLIDLNTWIMSDLLCLTLGTGALVLMMLYLKGHSRKAFYWSAVLAGLAFLTRYAGVSFFITGLLAILLLDARFDRQHLKTGVIYSLIATGPALGWVIFDAIASGAVSSRSLLPINTLPGGVIDVLKALKESVYLWLPSIMSFSQKVGQILFRTTYLLAALGLLVAVIIALLRVRKQRPDDWRMTSGMIYGALFCIFIVVYFVTITLSYSLTYPRISLVDRMFAPFNVSLIVIISLIIALLYQASRHLLPRLFIILLVVGLGWLFNIGAQAKIAQMIEYPLWYVTINNNGVFEYLDQLPEPTPIITDKTSIILYYTGRPAYPIQEFFKSEGQADLQPFGSDVTDETQRIFREENGALVLFWTVFSEFGGLYGDQASARYAAFVDELYLAYDSPEVKVYFYDQPPDR